MSGSSTVYDVKVKYSLDDKASSGVKNIASNTDKAAQSAFSLKSALAAVGGVALLSKGKEYLIDFNSEIEQMKIGMTAIMQMQLHMPFKKASDEADKLFKTFQELSKKSPATTKDFMEMAAAIAPAVANAGGGPDKLAKLTQGGVIASLAMGQRADVVGRDITQMLMGKVGVKDTLPMQLLGSKGIDHTDFNAKGGKERAKIVEDLLANNQAFKDAADRMGESFAGQTSTFKDTLQITLGEVGLPLMQQMTAEVKQWNTWIEKHPKQIKEWATSFSNGLKSGFEFLKSVAGFFVEHKELLMGLAKTFVMFKGAQLAGNVFSSFTQGVKGLADSLKNGISALSSGGGLKGITGALGGFTGIASGIATKVIPVLGLFAGAIKLATYALDTHRESDRKAREAAMDINEAIGDYPDLKDRREKLLKGGVGDAGRNATELANLEKTMFSPEHLGLALRKISDASEKHGGRSIKDMSTADIMKSSFANSLPNLYDYKKTKAENEEIYKKSIQVLELVQKTGVIDNGMQLDKILKYAFPEQYGMPTPEETPAPSSDWGGVDKANVNVTIQTVEVASEDPDRFVFGLVNIADNAIKHRTQSQHSTPGGF